jgi:hypothetical protein
VNRTEARAVLERHLAPWRQRSHADLRALVGDISVLEVVGDSGVEYTIEIEVWWDSLEEEVNLRVLASIDDGRLPGAILPVGDSFIVEPDGT